jgi:hypothetical protein
MDGRVSGPTGAPPAAGSPVTPPLVGRRDVLDEFSRLLNSIEDGTFILTGLAGEPGAGKTRLLAELAAGAEDRGLLTLWGRAAEFEQELPFGLVVDAFDAYLESLDPRTYDRLAADGLEELGSVFRRCARSATRRRPRRALPSASEPITRSVS